MFFEFSTFFCQQRGQFHYCECLPHSSSTYRTRRRRSPSDLNQNFDYFATSVLIQCSWFLKHVPKVKRHVSCPITFRILWLVVPSENNHKRQRYLPFNKLCLLVCVFLYGWTVGFKHFPKNREIRKIEGLEFKQIWVNVKLHDSQRNAMKCNKIVEAFDQMTRIENCSIHRMM